MAQHLTDLGQRRPGLSAMAHTRLYRDGQLALEDFPVEDISDHLDGGGPNVVWLDLCAPKPADLAMVRAEFGLHELAVEDAINPHQRPKLDRYSTHLFLGRLRRAPRPCHRATGHPGDRRVHHPPRTDHCPQGRRLPHPGRSLTGGRTTPIWPATAWRTCSTGCWTTSSTPTSPPSRNSTPSSKNWRTLLLDDTQPRTREVQRRSFELRKSLIRLRRVVLPMREVVNTLMRPTLHIVAEPMLPYYQDVYDHVLRASEWTESLRDLVTTTLETNLTVQGNRMNLIMKKVTSWAAIIAVPTAVTGFYGQNVPYPGFAKEWGFITSTAITIALSAALYMLFRRKDWL